MKHYEISDKEKVPAIKESAMEERPPIYTQIY